MDDSPRSQALTRIRVTFAVALAIALTTLLVFQASRRSVPVEAPSTEACPELHSLTPELTPLSVEELEQRLLSGGLVPPFAAKDQIRGIEATAAAYAPEKRACMLKVMLITSVASLPGMGRLPGLWGRDRPSTEIAQLYRTTPLRTNYTVAQREDLLAQVEQSILPSLKAERPEDTEFWRRMYYGLLLTCDATDSALEQLAATRPHDCLHLAPRP